MLWISMPLDSRRTLGFGQPLGRGLESWLTDSLLRSWTRLLGDDEGPIVSSMRMVVAFEWRLGWFFVTYKRYWPGVYMVVSKWLINSCHEGKSHMLTLGWHLGSSLSTYNEVLDGWS